nr:MAG TPA: hypothetical protein [Caudoviricetes sp.]
MIRRLQTSQDHWWVFCRSSTKTRKMRRIFKNGYAM